MEIWFLFFLSASAESAHSLGATLAAHQEQKSISTLLLRVFILIASYIAIKTFNMHAFPNIVQPSTEHKSFLSVINIKNIRNI